MQEQHTILDHAFKPAPCEQAVWESAKSGQKTDALLRLQTATTIVSVLLILTIATYGFYRIMNSYVLGEAEKDAVMISEAIIGRNPGNIYRSLLGPGRLSEKEKADLVLFEQRMRGFSELYRLFRIKIYDAERRVVFSTDERTVGRLDNTNADLALALTGGVVSELKTRGNVRDLAEEEAIHADVVETYVPIRGPENGSILGSFEIYMDVSRYRETTLRGVLLMAGMLACITVGVYGCSHVLIRNATRRLKELHGKLEIAAFTDKLTGLANRGRLLERGEEEFQRVKRGRNGGGDTVFLGCIMIDIDHFKEVNDTKGHPVGDQVICETARRIRQSVRPYDIVGRYGGEEFVVLLPDTTFEKSLLTARRIWESTRSECFESDKGQLCATISLGVASSAPADSGLEDLIKRADDGLYKAKQSGRDRVAWV